MGGRGGEGGLFLRHRPATKHHAGCSPWGAESRLRDGAPHALLFCSCCFPRCCTRGPRHSTRWSTHSVAIRAAQRCLLCLRRPCSAPSAGARACSHLQAPPRSRSRRREQRHAWPRGAGGAGQGAGPSARPREGRARPASTRPGVGLPPALPCGLVAEAPREKEVRQEEPGHSGRPALPLCGPDPQDTGPPRVSLPLCPGGARTAAPPAGSRPLL